VLAPLQEYKHAHPKVQILLQPAVGDAHHLPVHPQPPFPAAAASPALHVPAPAHLSLGPVLVSVTSIPVLPDLAMAETAQQVQLPVPHNSHSLSLQA
jgi:hypothetical protein